MVASPLELPGWLEFNAWRSGVTPYRYVVSSDRGSSIVAVLYLDRRGRIVLPPNNPYLFVGFESAVGRDSTRTAEWLRLGGSLVDEMQDRGVADILHLPPDIDDVRPWSWSGFSASVRYTYVTSFPPDESAVAPEIRRNIGRSERLGLSAERITDIEIAWPVIAETERRAGFSHGIDPPGLRRAADLLGDHLRMYACRDPSGDVLAVEIDLHAPGARTIGWIAATTSVGQELRAGPFLRRYTFRDLTESGATGIDMCGANIPAVASHKASTGALLLPTYDVRPASARSAARHVLDAMRSYRRARATRPSSDRSRPPRDEGPR